MSGDRFSMDAYTGAVVDSYFWDKLVIDISGMRLDPKLPALLEHQRNRPTGVIDGHNKLLRELKANGYFLTNGDGQELSALLDDGFPMQASIGCFFEEVERIGERESATVNGAKFEGPGTIVRQSYIREISFCVLGADSKTSSRKLTASPSQNTTNQQRRSKPMNQRRLLDEHPFMKEVKQFQLSHKCSMVKALEAVMQDQPRLHTDYIRAANER